MSFNLGKHVVLSLLSLYVLWISIRFFHKNTLNEYPHLKWSNPHVAGLILARGGSKGIPLKNLAKINNTTLLTRSLMTLDQFGKFNSVWVSTDDERIAKEAVQVPNVKVHARAAYTATDQATSVEAVQEFLTHHPEITIVVLVQCTSPFLAVKHLEQAFHLIKNGFHSVFSLTRQFKLRWKTGPGNAHKGETKKNPKFLFEGLIPENFDVEKRPRRQDWSGELVENGMFYMTYSDIVRSRGVLQGGKLAFVEIAQNESLEIDTVNELHLAEVLSKSLL